MFVWALGIAHAIEVAQPAESAAIAYVHTASERGSDSSAATAYFRQVVLDHTVVLDIPDAGDAEFIARSMREEATRHTLYRATNRDSEYAIHASLGETDIREWTGTEQRFRDVIVGYVWVANPTYLALVERENALLVERAAAVKRLDAELTDLEYDIALHKLESIDCALDALDGQFASTPREIEQAVTETRAYWVTTHTRELTLGAALTFDGGVQDFGCVATTTDISHPPLPHVGLGGDPLWFPRSDGDLEVSCERRLAGKARSWIAAGAKEHRREIKAMARDTSLPLDSQVSAQLAWHHLKRKKRPDSSLRKTAEQILGNRRDARKLRIPKG